MDYCHLQFNMMGAAADGVNEHPQDVMLKMGIAYEHATPQTIGDQWWFWNCTNIPAVLPEFMSYLNIEPMDYIGFGLSEEVARKLTKSNS